MRTQSSLGHCKSVEYEYGLAGTGQLLIKYPNLDFRVDNFFALGSPISVFLNVRGIDTLGEEFRFPNCKGFFNIFHPVSVPRVGRDNRDFDFYKFVYIFKYDPVAYRIEPIICPKLDVKPVLMPHHLGRKRMHLEIREGLAKVGGDLKQKMMDKLKTTWFSLQEFAKAHTSAANPPAVTNEDGPNVSSIERDAMATQVKFELDESSIHMALAGDADTTVSSTNTSTSPDELNVRIGSLNNGGRRVDYVLQERPIESFNEYLFALASHACYWESEDTLLLIVKEVYSTLDLKPDQTQPLAGMAAIEQQSMMIAQVAASTLTSTLSYLKSSLPQSLSLPTVSKPAIQQQPKEENI